MIVRRGAVIVTLALAPAATTEQSQIRFENRQAQSRIHFVLHNGTTPNKPIIDSTLGGVGLLDFDNDGYLDVFFTNGRSNSGLGQGQ